MRQSAVTVVAILVFSALASAGFIPDLTTYAKGESHDETWADIRKTVQDRVNNAAIAGDKKTQKYWAKVDDRLRKANEWSHRTDKERVKHLFVALKAIMKDDSVPVDDKERFLSLLRKLGWDMDKEFWYDDGEFPISPKEILISSGVAEKKFKKYDKLGEKLGRFHRELMETSRSFKERLASTKKFLLTRIKEAGIIKKLFDSMTPPR